MRVALALLLLAATASAATWTAAYPTTGEPCVEWRWRAFDPSGFVFHDALTDSNHATIPEPDVPQRVECQCFDAQGRPSPWSHASEPHYPSRLFLQYARAGKAVGVGPLAMWVALVRGVAWTDTTEAKR